MNTISRVFSFGLLSAGISAAGVPSAMAHEANGSGPIIATSEGFSGPDVEAFTPDSLNLKKQQDSMTRTLRNAFGTSYGPEWRAHALFDVDTAPLANLEQPSPPIHSSVIIDLTFGGEGAETREAYPFQFRSENHPAPAMALPRNGLAQCRLIAMA